MKIESMDAKILQPKKIIKIENERNLKVNRDELKNLDKIDKNKHLSNYEKKNLPVDEKALVDAIDKLNRAITGSNRRFEYSVHDKTKEIIVKVIDTDNNQIVREIPSENILDMVANMCEMAGIVYDKKG